MRTLVFCVFGVKWVTPRTEVDLLVSWKGHFGKWHNIELWKFIPLGLIKKKKKKVHSFGFNVEYLKRKGMRELFERNELLVRKLKFLSLRLLYKWMPTNFLLSSQNNWNFVILWILNNNFFLIKKNWGFLLYTSHLLG